MYSAVLNNLNSIIDTVEADKELCQMLKESRKHVVNKIKELIV